MNAYTDWMLDQMTDEDWERIQQHEDAQAEVDDWRKYDHQDHEAAAAYYDELSEMEAEASDYEEDMLDREYHARGMW